MRQYDVPIREHALAAPGAFGLTRTSRRLGFTTPYAKISRYIISHAFDTSCFIVRVI